MLNLLLQLRDIDHQSDNLCVFCKDAVEKVNRFFLMIQIGKNATVVGLNLASLMDGESHFMQHSWLGNINVRNLWYCIWFGVYGFVWVGVDKNYNIITNFEMIEDLIDDY
ncbi:hypothetical protein Lalb_Chr05g0222621 [Lupinus albus]|uniref:Uncharacterized protein n=1 Tax=Lupinus albus TaxID=3870 RepID=A0A6A4QKC5_LUPAL|nr:hypothetical protein Lalb_Chr05g0222621 [Lupinus albus]